MKFSDNLAKVLFVLSLVFFAFLYGIATGYKSWPPTRFLDKAVGQARDLGILQSLPFTDKTKPFPKTVPQVYNREGVQISQPEKVQPGLTLITSLWDWDDSGDLDVGAKLINKKGNILHSWKLNENKLFPNSIDLGGPYPKPEKADFLRAYLFSNGDLLLNLNNIGTVRLDACGNVRWRLSEITHHTISRAEDGTFWFPAVSKEKRTVSELYPNGFPGLSGKKVWVDRLLQVTEDGEILTDINVLDVLYMNDLERYIPKVLGGPYPEPEKVPDDITHLNDVEALAQSMADEYPLFEAGDLLVSLRHLHLVFVFDPETMDVKWHASEPFIYQHDPDFIGDGWIGVFNNNTDLTRGNRVQDNTVSTKRGKMLGGSQIIYLQPHTDSVQVRFPTQNSEHFYTNSRGGWQLLDNGNILMTEENAGRIVEVSPDGRTVWEWFPKSVWDSRVPATMKGTRYDLTKEQVASWPCSSVSSSENTQQEGG